MTSFEITETVCFMLDFIVKAKSSVHSWNITLSIANVVSDGRSFKSNVY